MLFPAHNTVSVEMLVEEVFVVGVDRDLVTEKVCVSKIFLKTGARSVLDIFQSWILDTDLRAELIRRSTDTTDSARTERVWVRVVGPTGVRVLDAHGARRNL